IPHKMAVLLPTDPGSLSSPPPARVGRGFGARTVLMVLGLTLGVFLLLALGYLAWRALTWVLIAMFLAMALNPAVRVFERIGLRRGLAATAVFFIAAAIAAGLGFLL